MGVESPIPFQEAKLSAYMLYAVGVATTTSQFAKCQSADFFSVCQFAKCPSANLENLVCAMLLTEPTIIALPPTLLSTDH